MNDTKDFEFIYAIKRVYRTHTYSNICIFNGLQILETPSFNHVITLDDIDIYNTLTDWWNNDVVTLECKAKIRGMIIDEANKLLKKQKQLEIEKHERDRVIVSNWCKNTCVKSSEEKRCNSKPSLFSRIFKKRCNDDDDDDEWLIT